MAERDDIPAAEQTARAETPEEARAHARHTRRRLILGVGVWLVLMVLLILPVFSTLQPGYYGRYPDLRVRMDHWRDSTHAKIGCIACHVDPGAGSFLSFAARSVPAFYSQLLGGPKATNLLGAPDKQGCQSCHTDYRQVSPNGDLLIPHRAHVEVLKINCVVCHKNLVHSVNAKGYNSPEMATCLKCHDGVTAKNQCSACHTQKQVPDSHKNKDWLKVHGSMSKTIDCGKCHNWTPDYCGDCHKHRPPTHVGNWKKNHAAEAKQHADGCLVCHSMAKFCKNCH